MADVRQELALRARDGELLRARVDFVLEMESQSIELFVHASKAKRQRDAHRRDHGAEAECGDGKIERPAQRKNVVRELRGLHGDHDDAAERDDARFDVAASHFAEDENRGDDEQRQKPQPADRAAVHHRADVRPRRDEHGECDVRELIGAKRARDRSREERPEKLNRQCGGEMAGRVGESHGERSPETRDKVASQAILNQCGEFARTTFYAIADWHIERFF